MGEFETIFERKVEDCLALYPSYIEQVRPELNGLFREEDYPSVEKVRTKFGVNLEVLPIPSGKHFRVTLSAEEQARVAQEIDANIRQSLARGTVDLWKRLQDVVSHMVDRLNEPESRFHASLVSNVLDLVDLLPQLNVGEDRDLNRFAGEIRNKLCGFTARVLKTNDELRVAAANDAAALLYEMDAVLGIANKRTTLLRRGTRQQTRSSCTCPRTWRPSRNEPHTCNSNHEMAVF